MTAPDGKIRIPLNEEASKSTGQIEEFLMKYNGEGIQHIALLTDDLLATSTACESRRSLDGGAAGDVLRNARRTASRTRREVEELQARGILLDGTTEGGKQRLLLQFFSQTVLGPVFFEFIQRKGDDGFGEGNFKALFESLERDQLRRGVIQAAEWTSESSEVTSRAARTTVEFTRSPIHLFTRHRACDRLNGYRLWPLRTR